MSLELPRRSVLLGLGGLLTAPLVARASSLMPLRGTPLLSRRWLVDYCIASDQMIVRLDVAYGKKLLIPKHVWELDLPTQQRLEKELAPQIALAEQQVLHEGSMAHPVQKFISVPYRPHYPSDHQRKVLGDS